MPGPLKNRIEEQFAQAVAAQVSPKDAYAAGHPKASKKTAMEAASRFTRKPQIVARIAELHAIGQKTIEKAQEQVARATVKKLTGVLLTMTDRRRLMGEIVMTATDPEIRMRAAMNDAKLAGDLIDKTDLTTDGEALPSVMPSIQMNLPPSFLQRRTGSN